VVQGQGEQGDPTRLDTIMLAFDALKDHGTEKTRAPMLLLYGHHGQPGS
jgi:hypothetical protein